MNVKLLIALFAVFLASITAACGDDDVDVNDLSDTEFAAHMFGGDEDDWDFDDETETYIYDGSAITIEVPEGFVVSTKGKCYTEGDRVSRVKEAMVAEGEDEEDCPTDAAVSDEDTDDTNATATPAATQGSSGTTGNQPDWLGSQCKLAPSISAVSEKIKTSFTASDSLAYPDMIAVDPGRSGPRFPDTDEYGHPPRVAYEQSSEDANYFEDCFGDMDVPQFYYRVNTAGYFWIPKSDDTGEDIVCMAEEHKGCALITINHFGPTMKLNGVFVDNGFTYFGRVFNMETPQMVTDAAQDLTDHVNYRMIYGDSPQTGFNDGTNCGDINGCTDVEWHVVVYGNGTLQKHWTGLYAP